MLYNIMNELLTQNNYQDAYIMAFTFLEDISKMETYFGFIEVHLE